MTEIIKSGLDEGDKMLDAVTRRGNGDPIAAPSKEIADQFETVERKAGITPKRLDEVRARRGECAHGPHNRLQYWLAQMRSKPKGLR